MKFLAWLALILAATSASAFSQGFGWSIVNGQIRRKFPDVPRVTTDELANWLHDAKREKPLLLDVRTEKEFAVSHFAGARRVEPGADPRTLSLPRDKEIVTYCSVGYRSAVLAKNLCAAGYTHVRNLEGSIFRWANEGRPLVRENNQPTDKVDPYNGLWGILLEKSHRATSTNAPPQLEPAPAVQPKQ